MSLPTSSPRLRSLAWLLAASLLVMLAGCASVQTSGAIAGHGLRSEAMLQAETLAQQATTQSGAERAQTEKQIDTLLSALDNPTLQREAASLPAGNPLYSYAGRALLRRGLPLPRPFDRTAWKFNAGNRPPGESDGYRPPVKLAVLLPLSGSLATAAAPVRDGFLTGYYGETRRRPDVNFYDTSTGASAAYDRAVAEGNDFVVGPLGRDEVGALFNRGTLPVPVLALNRSPSPPPAGNASFSLSPEDEGIAAAEYLLDHGAHRVLVISAEDDTQRRAVASLRERLAERGGSVTDVAGEGVADFAPFAAKEGGVDAIFLAVKGGVARQLMPRIALAGLAGKPRVATSQLLSGTGKAEDDRVLDGIAFPSESWTTRGARGLPPAASAAAMLPNAKGPAARLFAFGFDAWLITAYLERLATSSEGIAGATGVLRIDGFGNVQRTPAWSTFSSGVAVPLADASRR